MGFLSGRSDLSGDRALDVATGSGGLAFELAERFGEVVAVDLPDVLARVAPAPHERIRWQGMDAEALAFPDASFDAVAVAWSLHHFRDPRRVLGEMRRVLRPGGRLVVVEPFVAWTGTNRDHHLRAHMLGAHLDRARGVWHAEIFLRERVESLVRALGLEALAIEAVMAPDDGWEGSAEEREAAIATWAGYMERTAGEPAVLPEVRHAALACAAAVRREGIAASPYLVLQGLKP